MHYALTALIARLLAISKNKNTFVSLGMLLLRALF